jgi:hypothetical protein
MITIFCDFRQFSSGEKLAFLTRNKAKLCKNFIIALVFEKNANFFAEHCQKSQKIVIITSTPGRTASESHADAKFREDVFGLDNLHPRIEPILST